MSNSKKSSPVSVTVPPVYKPMAQRKPQAVIATPAPARVPVAIPGQPIQRKVNVPPAFSPNPLRSARQVKPISPPPAFVRTPSLFGQRTFPGVVQRAADPSLCPFCHNRFNGAKGVASHSWRCPSRPAAASSAAAGSGDDSDGDVSVLSEYSYADDLEELYSQGGYSDKVLKAYTEGKGEDLVVNTSEGLSAVVTLFDTGKQPAANTHVLVGHAGTYRSYAMNTATAVKMALGRFNVGSATSSRNAHPQGHVHAEMHMLYDLTKGNKDKIAGILKGKVIVVDKEICGDCYPFVVLAQPEEIRDGSNGKAASARDKWADWTNPFK